MQDIDNLYPAGYHPVQCGRSPDMKTSHVFVCRGLIRVRYYNVDFGMSTRFLPGEPRLVTGELGRDREAPELSDTVPYDPFKVDIFIIGNRLRQEFHEVQSVIPSSIFGSECTSQKYANVDFLLPLVNAMTASRPDAAAALRLWKKLRRRIWSVHRAWRLRWHNESKTLKRILDVEAFLRLGLWIPYRVRCASSKVVSGFQRVLRD